MVAPPPPYFVIHSISLPRSFSQDESLPHHDKVPNLKLVMNPGGKVHDWTDLPEEELPEMQVMAQGGVSPETAHHVVENLQACKGKGADPK